MPKKAVARPRSGQMVAKRAQTCAVLEQAVKLERKDLDNLTVDLLRRYRLGVAVLHARLDELHGTRIEQKVYTRKDPDRPTAQEQQLGLLLLALLLQRRNT